MEGQYSSFVVRTERFAAETEEEDSRPATIRRITIEKGTY